MQIDMNFDSFDKILKEVEKLATSTEIDEVAEKIVNEESEIAKSEISSRFPKSKDNSKSGKRGYRPSGHFAENVPKSKVKKKKGYIYIVIGEEKDEGEYFYTKFPEWGTSKIKPALVFAKVREQIQKELEEKGIEEYSKLLQEKLGG